MKRFKEKIEEMGATCGGLTACVGQQIGCKGGKCGCGEEDTYELASGAQEYNVSADGFDYNSRQSDKPFQN